MEHTPLEGGSAHMAVKMIVPQEYLISPGDLISWILVFMPNREIWAIAPLDRGTYNIVT